MKKEHKQALWDMRWWILIVGVIITIGMTVFVKLLFPSAAQLGSLYEDDKVLASIVYAVKAQEINENQPLQKVTLAELLEDDFQQGVGLLLPADRYQEAAKCDNLNGIIIRRLNKEEGFEIKADPLVCKGDTKEPLTIKKTLSSDLRSITINTDMPAKDDASEHNKDTRGH